MRIALPLHVGPLQLVNVQAPPGHFVGSEQWLYSQAPSLQTWSHLTLNAMANGLCMAINTAVK